MRQKKLSQLTEKEKQFLNRFISTAKISSFNEVEVKRKLAKTLTDLLDIIDTLLYGDDRTTKRTGKGIRRYNR